MVSKHTLDTIRTFCRPGIETGIIPADEFRELLKLAKTTQNGTDTTEAPDPTQFLTLKSAADKLSCSKRTISRMIQDGRLRSVRLTGSRKSLRIPAQTLARLIVEGQGDE